MSTTIAIVTGTPDHRGPAVDHGVYPVIPGRMNTADLVADGDSPVFDTMVSLADGSIVAPFNDDHDRCDVRWVAITTNWVAGYAHDITTGSPNRLAVIDLDNANGLDVLRVINWVNHIDGADLPA
jgi:hypothetical protein